jgi:hypothetical protein
MVRYRYRYYFLYKRVSRGGDKVSKYSPFTNLISFYRGVNRACMRPLCGTMSA